MPFGINIDTAKNNQISSNYNYNNKKKKTKISRSLFCFTFRFNSLLRVLRSPRGDGCLALGLSAF